MFAHILGTQGVSQNIELMALSGTSTQDEYGHFSSIWTSGVFASAMVYSSIDTRTPEMDGDLTERPIDMYIKSTETVGIGDKWRYSGTTVEYQVNGIDSESRLGEEVVLFKVTSAVIAKDS